MCLFRSHFGQTIYLQNVHMIHTLRGSRACVSLGRTSARPYSYQTYMWSIPFMVPGHVSHQVKTAARTYSYKTYKWYTPCMVSGHVSHQVFSWYLLNNTSLNWFIGFTPSCVISWCSILHYRKLHRRVKFLNLNSTLQKTTPSCVVSWFSILDYKQKLHRLM